MLSLKLEFLFHILKDTERCLLLLLDMIEIYIDVHEINMAPEE